MGFAWAWPSAAYEEVMESITDCAFSWPISVGKERDFQVSAKELRNSTSTITCRQS
jgi:hypothetical protein